MLNEPGTSYSNNFKSYTSLRENYSTHCFVLKIAEEFKDYRFVHFDNFIHYIKLFRETRGKEFAALYTFLKSSPFEEPDDFANKLLIFFLARKLLGEFPDLDHIEFALGLDRYEFRGLDYTYYIPVQIIDIDRYNKRLPSIKRKKIENTKLPSSFDKLVESVFGPDKTNVLSNWKKENNEDEIECLDVPVVDYLDEEDIILSYIIFTRLYSIIKAG